MRLTASSRSTFISQTCARGGSSTIFLDSSRSLPPSNPLNARPLPFSLLPSFPPSLFPLPLLLDRSLWLDLPSVRPAGPAALSLAQAYRLPPCIDPPAQLVAHEPDGEWLDIAPMRILSFDIECAGRPGVFPEAEKDPVIQIANHVTLQGSTQPIVKNVFTLKECAPISGAQARLLLQSLAGRCS